MSTSLAPFLEDSVIYCSAMSLSELLPGIQAVTSPGFWPNSLGPGERRFPFRLFGGNFQRYSILASSISWNYGWGLWKLLFLFFLACISACEIPLSINGWSRCCSPHPILNHEKAAGAFCNGKKVTNGKITAKEHRLKDHLLKHNGRGSSVCLIRGNNSLPAPEMWEEPQASVIGQHRQSQVRDFLSIHSTGSLQTPRVRDGPCSPCFGDSDKLFCGFYEAWGIQGLILYATDMFFPNRYSAWLDTWLPFGKRARSGHGRRTFLGMGLEGAPVHSLKRLLHQIWSIPNSVAAHIQASFPTT